MVGPAAVVPEVRSGGILGKLLRPVGSVIHNAVSKMYANADDGPLDLVSQKLLSHLVVEPQATHTISVAAEEKKINMPPRTLKRRVIQAASAVYFGAPLCCWVL